MPTVVRVARLDEAILSHGRRVEVKRQRIALFNVGGQYYAIDATGLHRGTHLSDGALEETAVVSPWHDAAFDPAT